MKTRTGGHAVDRSIGETELSHHIMPYWRDRAIVQYYALLTRQSYRTILCLIGETELSYNIMPELITRVFRVTRRHLQNDSHHTVLVLLCFSPIK